MTAPAITEISNDEIIVRYSSRVFRPVSRTVTVPDTLSGDYVSAVAVVTSVQLDDAQEAALEAAIQNIAGVGLAKILVGSSRLSHDRLPADTAEETYDLQVRLEMGLDAIATPVAVP
jgi:hypothetical protein